jgi:hypothetical protein
MFLAATLVGCFVLGCSTSQADRDAATRAWTERDAERQGECAKKGGKWVAGACLFGTGA